MPYHTNEKKKKVVKKKVVKKTDKLKEKLKEHSKHHSVKHMRIMKKNIKEGMSFTKSHNLAKKMVGK